MPNQNDGVPLKDLFTKTDRDSLVIFLGGGVLLAVYMNYGSTTFAARMLDLSPESPGAVIWQFFASFLLFSGLLRRPLSDLGVGLGNLGFTLKILGFFLPFVVIPAVYISAYDPEIRAEYPLAVGLADDVGRLILYELCYLLYYVGWEVFFRGLLVLGLSRRIGPFPAIGVSTLVSTAIHYGKPGAEVWTALIAGVLLGMLALRTRSLLGPLVFHAVTGVLTDCLVLFSSGPLR